jgi:hypothetical protein
MTRIILNSFHKPSGALIDGEMPISPLHHQARPSALVTQGQQKCADERWRGKPKMSEHELVFHVKELHVISLTCSECGHGTIFDFKSTDYLEKSVSPKCSICKTELEVDLQEQLKAYRGFYDSMSACERVEFRVRLNQPEAAASEAATEVTQAVSTAVAEVQEAVAKALAKGTAD